MKIMKGINHRYCFRPQEKFKLDISAPQFEHLSCAFILISFFAHNGGVERSPRNAGALKARRSEADFRSNDLLAARESARGAFSHVLYLYIFISIFYAKNKSGRAEPVGAANSAVSAARSAALTICITCAGNRQSKKPDTANPRQVDAVVICSARSFEIFFRTPSRIFMQFKNISICKQRV